MALSPVSTYTFAVEPFTEDAAGRLSWRVLGNRLLRCAGLHAAERGFGFADVVQSGRAWVLSRLVIEMQRMPASGEGYAISTWVAGLKRQFTERRYRIAAPGGEVLGYAYSIWALISTDTRRPIDLSAMGDEAAPLRAVPDEPFPDIRPGRIRVHEAERPAAEHTCRYTDLDVNGHLNSIRYIELLLDLFPPERFGSAGERPAAPRRIDMAYCAETAPGERIRLFADDLSGDSVQVEMRKDDGTVVARGEVTF